MRTYSDEYLEYFADKYHTLRLDKHGVSLDEYLASPSKYNHLEDICFPLLPEQITVANKLQGDPV